MTLESSYQKSEEDNKKTYCELHSYETRVPLRSLEATA